MLLEIDIFINKRCFTYLVQCEDSLISDRLIKLPEKYFDRDNHNTLMINVFINLHFNLSITRRAGRWKGSDFGNLYTNKHIMVKMRLKIIKSYLDPKP